jgi:hypothetical protein
LALRFEGESWTYGQMQRCIENCDARFNALGLGKGDRMAFVGLNQPMFPFSMVATFKWARHRQLSLRIPTRVGIYGRLGFPTLAA